MQIPPCPHARRHCAGFLSRTEVIVVALVVAALFVLLLVATSSTGNRAERAQCLKNLKQLDTAILLYAQQNKNRLPSVPTGYWAWDLPTPFADSLLRLGVTRDTLYDPGNTNQNSDDLWNWHDGFRIIGYAMTLPGTASFGPTNQNRSILPPPTNTPARTSASNPSQRVLVAGVVLSDFRQSDANQRDSYNYTEIRGAWNGVHRASHLDDTGKFPDGDNVGLLDGSVKWRNFRDMLPRTDPNPYSPTFWW